MDIDEKIKEEQLKYYQRENELREAILKRQRLKWKITKWTIIIGAICIFIITVVLPSIFVRITVDANGDGYYEVITIPRWEQYKYEESMKALQEQLDKIK